MGSAALPPRSVAAPLPAAALLPVVSPP
jgi:hypothetical protein